MVSCHRCILRADNTAWLLACFLEKQTPLGPREWLRGRSSGTSSPWACEGGGPACEGDPSSREHAAAWRAITGLSPTRPVPLSSPAGVPRGRGLTAGVSSGTGRGAGGTRGGRRCAVGKARQPVPTDRRWRCWAGGLRPGGAVSRPVSAHRQGRSPGPALCSYESGGLGATAPAGFSPPSLQLSRAAGRQGRRGGLWLIPDITAPFPSRAPSSETLPRWGLDGSQDPWVNPWPTRASSSAGNPRTDLPLSHHSASFLPNMWITRPCRGGLPGEPALMGTRPAGVVGRPRHLLSGQTHTAKTACLSWPTQQTPRPPSPGPRPCGRAARPRQISQEIH